MIALNILISRKNRQADQCSAFPSASTSSFAVEWIFCLYASSQSSMAPGPLASVCRKTSTFQRSAIILFLRNPLMAFRISV